AEIDDAHRKRFALDHADLVKGSAETTLQSQDVADFDIGTLLVRVNLITAQRRERPFVLVVEMDGGSRLKQIRPHPEPGVVAAAVLPFAGGNEEPVVEDEVCVLRFPSKLHRLDLDVGERERTRDIERVAFNARLD